MSILDRATLEESTLADLHAIAGELAIDGYRRLRKSDLIDTIVGHQGGEEAPARSGRSSRTRIASSRTRGESESARTESARAHGESESARTESSRARGESEPARAEPARTEPAAASEDDEEGAGSRRRRGRRGGRGRAVTRSEAPDGQEADADQPEAPAGRPAGGRRREEGEPEIVEGVVELLPNGSGFVRLTPPEPSDSDVYISAAQVKRCELVNGDRITGPRRSPHRSERFPSLVRIDTVNGRPAEELADRGRFDDLAAEFPSQRFELGSDDATLKAVEFLTPFGRGSRVTITGGTWAGKSHLLRQLASVLTAQEGVSVYVALAGIRPEELAEWAEAPVKPGAAVSFAASTETQDNAVELVVDQARRLAARGSDAVVLIDTLDGLHPLSARRALASARKLRDGGSLTVIATSSKPLGGETTVISLDAALAKSARYPALDLLASGTLRPELLVGVKGAQAISKERIKAMK